MLPIQSCRSRDGGWAMGACLNILPKLRLLVLSTISGTLEWLVKSPYLPLLGIAFVLSLPTPHQLAWGRKENWHLHNLKFLLSSVQHTDSDRQTDRQAERERGRKEGIKGGWRLQRLFPSSYIMTELCLTEFLFSVVAGETPHMNTPYIQLGRLQTIWEGVMVNTQVLSLEIALLS